MGSILQSPAGLPHLFQLSTHDTAPQEPHMSRCKDLKLGYSSSEVVAVAKIHPFYAANVGYPPDAAQIRAAREQASQGLSCDAVATLPLLWKSCLYKTIARLVHDQSPRNTLCQGVYISITGGGSASIPMLFATDVHENRQHRAHFGRFIRSMGVIEDRDWVITTHPSGHLYRSLDLTLELLENAGASALAAGQHMSAAEVIQLLFVYNANVLSGESSQIVHIVYHISTLTPEERARIKINKIIYTSEGLTPAQRRHILNVLGPVKICSFLGSAEAGPYGVSCPSPNGNYEVTAYEDFIFDTRLMLIEVFPATVAENDPTPKPLPEGRQGVIAQTSLTRLRNPLVRYVTGDIGSLHPVPEHVCAIVSEKERKHLRVLRLQGRDRRFSFEWDGGYYEFEQLNLLMNDPQSGILQWQVILGKLKPSLEASLEFRVLHAETNASTASRDALASRIERFCNIDEENRFRFKITFLGDIDGFERSKTGRKVIKFVNNFN